MKLFLSKFFKAFLTGGVAAISGAVSAGVSFNTLEQAKHAVVVLLIAFASGAFHALWAMYTASPTA